MPEARPHRFNRIEQDFGLPKDWLRRLIDEADDWSFVIKLHALFEAIITRLLEAEVARSGLQEFVSNLPLGGQFGKMQLARKLEVMGDDSARFIRFLGIFRNACVHDVRYVDFQFAKYLPEMPEKQRNEMVSLIREMCFVAIPEEKKDQINQIVASEFRVGVFLASIIVLSVLHQRKEDAQSVSAAIARTLEQHGPDFFVDDILDWDSQRVPDWRSCLPKTK